MQVYLCTMQPDPGCTGFLMLYVEDLVVTSILVYYAVHYRKKVM